MKSPSVKRMFKRNVEKSVDNVDKNVKKSGKSGGNFKFFDLLSKLFVGMGNFFLVVCRTAIIVLTDIAIAMGIACGGIPCTIVLLSNMLGVGVNSSLVDMFFVFGFPVLFMTLLWVVFAVWLLRYINRYILGLFDKIKAIGNTCSDSSSK